MLHGRLTSRWLARISGLSLLAALTLAAAPVAAEAAFPGPTGPIAYLDKYSDIHVVQPDGRGDRVVYRAGGSGAYPDWGNWHADGVSISPDGQRILFSAHNSCDCRSQDQGRIATISLDGGRPAILWQDSEDRGPHNLAGASWSPDGRTVAFTGDDDDSDRRLYTLDLADGTPRKVALNGLTFPSEPQFSPDGTRIAFHAEAESGYHIYVAPLGGSPVRVSPLEGDQFTPAWSPDGERIAYVDHYADDRSDRLVVGFASGGGGDVIVDEHGENRDSSVGGRPAWSPDGKQVAFMVNTYASNDAQCMGEVRVKALDAGGRGTRVACLPGGFGEALDWGVKRASGETRLVSRSTAGEKIGGNGDTSALSLTAKGRFAFFTSAATDLVDADNDNAPDVFRRDIASGDVTLVAEGDTPVGSADGRFVAYHAAGGVFERDLEGATVRVAATGTPIAVSDDGRYVLYRDGGIFRFDRTTATSAPVAAQAGDARMSADGRYVAFSSDATDLVDGFADHNGAAPSLFRRDMADGVTTLVDGAAGSATDTTAEGSELRGFSADGSTVLFASRAADVIAGFTPSPDANAPELYARRAGAAAAQLVSSRWNGTAEGTARDVLGPAAISADGKVVLFTSDGWPLVDGIHDEDGAAADVWIRRLDADKAELVSTGADGPDWTGNGGSAVAGLSGDGRFALIRSAATDLTEPVSPHGHDGLYRIDLRTHAVSTIAVPSEEIADAQISADGQTAAYRTDADDVLDGFMDLNFAGSDAFAWVDRSIVDADVIAPDITIDQPTDGGVYRKGRTYDARFSCHDVGGSGLDSCVGTTPAGAAIDTDTTGEKAFTVTATDKAGNTSSRTIRYRVALSNDHLSLVSGTGTTSNPDAASGVVIGGEYAAYESGGKVLRRNLRTGALDTVADGAEPRISADGRFVAFVSGGKLLVRDMDAATTRVVYTGDTTEHAISGDGSTVVYAAGGSVYAEGKKLGGGEDAQVSADGRRVLYRSGTALYVWDGTASKPVATATAGLLSADGTTVVHGDGEHLYRDGKLLADGDIAKTRMSGDGRTVVWSAGDALLASTDGHAATAIVSQEGSAFAPRAISGDGRFVLYDQDGDLRRVDLQRDDRVSAVESSPLAPVEHVGMSTDGRRIVFDTTSTNMVDDFHDGNGDGADVYAWFDNPPTANALARITGPLALAFDGSGSTDADGQIVSFHWDFGDGRTSTAIKPSHVYDDEDTFTVRLTIEDDGSNAVTYELEAVAIKGVLTAGGAPLDFLGVDKHLRCSAVREHELFTGGGGDCGTFVALGGKLYGPPELVAGVVAYTPVSQVVSQDGDVAKIVTTVALGDTGVRARQTDRYAAGTAWYRTDVALIGDGGAARDAIVYRGAHCVPGHPLHDAGTAMAGCSGAFDSALLPLTPGATHSAGAGVLDHLGAPLDDTCACDATDPSMAIGWSVSVPAGGEVTRASLASFGPDGTIPLTVALKPDKDVVQPLDDNGFTVTLRNANGVARPVGPIVAESGGVWDYVPGSATGLTTADPAWTGPFGIGAHSAGTLHFGVVHRNGTRIAVTTVTAAPAAGVTSTGIADLGEAKASVDAHPIEGSIPNTAIYEGPAGPTNDPQPHFQLVASKDSGVTYECRFAPAAWKPCDADYRPGPLADGSYALQVRAKDAFGADETPATRAFTVDTIAPNTVIASGPRRVINVDRAGFELRAGEPGSHLECRLDGGAWFPCTSPWTTNQLVDGEHVFEARAIDAAGNVDPTPARWEFRIDTTPPVTTIDGLDGHIVARSGSGAGATAAGAGASVAIGADGSAPLSIACPADGPACSGSVGLAMNGGDAGLGSVKSVMPRGAITLARTEFSAAPGQTVTVRLSLPMATRNQVERLGKVAVFPALDLGSGPVRGADLTLTPDPRTARFLDAGKSLELDHGRVTLHLACATRCSGRITLAGHTKTFSGRRIKVRMKAKRGTHSVRITTKPALTKRLTVTLRAKEARR